MVQVMFKGFKGVCADHDPAADYSFPSLSVIPNADNLIWAVKNNQLYYFSYTDFKNAKITNNTKEFTFKMKAHPDKITCDDDLRKVMDL
jgi:hypothetical protein